MIYSTTDQIQDKKYEIIDVIYGIGETLQIAIDALVNNANKMKADAVIGMRINNNPYYDGSYEKVNAEYLVYGTAVKFI